MPACLSPSAKKPATKRRIITVRVEQRVNRVRVLQVPGRHGILGPGVERQGRVSRTPAGGPHRESFGGQITDQRVCNFGSELTHSQASRRAAQDLVFHLHLQPPLVALQLHDLRLLSGRQPALDPVINVGLLHLAANNLLRDPEVNSKLDNAQVTATGDRDHISVELIWVVLCHNDILSED